MGCRALSTVCVLATAACGGGSDPHPAELDAPGAADGMQPGGDAPAVMLEDLHFIGRFDADRRFAWPGSQIAATFDGTAIGIDLEDTGGDWFDVTIDGATQVLRPSAGRGTYEVGTALAAGEHTIALVKRTESFVGTSRFHGFTGATLVPSPRPTRTLELIGDSITCGYGVLGAGPACSFSADTEAETHAWGMFAATELGAVHHAIAYSGIGMVRNNDGSTDATMPRRYERIVADDPGSVWTPGDPPAVFVIDLGTNDFAAGDPGQPYRDAYVAFVRDQLRARAPQAEIFLATSPMLSDSYPQGAQNRTKARAHLDAIAATLADARVHVVDIPEQLGSDGLGCDYHPNEVTQHKMAAALVAAIRPLTGW